MLVVIIRGSGFRLIKEGAGRIHVGASRVCLCSRSIIMGVGVRTMGVVFFAGLAGRQGERQTKSKKEGEKSAHHYGIKVGF